MQRMTISLQSSDDVEDIKELMDSCGVPQEHGFEKLDIYSTNGVTIEIHSGVDTPKSNIEVWLDSDCNADFTAWIGSLILDLVDSNHDPKGEDYE